MIISSYEFLPADKRFFFGFNKNPTASANFPDHPDALKILRNKVQHVEDNTTFYHIQFSKFQDRLKIIEEKVAMNPQKITTITTSDVNFEEEEDWKELYYGENSKKEVLENELDFARQALEKAENKLNEIEGKTDRLTQLQSDYELRLNDLQSMQNEIIHLQQQFEASVEREKELEQLLLSEITMREKYSLLQREYAGLLSETDDLRRRSIEVSNYDFN
ncbi:MAG TPA: hypothetical protein VGP55_09765 [Chitinophagaceae bacterium]|nr:hypothetical protein [Chitinophagaceae bacterium]